MMRWLFLLFLIIPALEIGLFLWVGGLTSPWFVVLLIIFTGFAGVYLAKKQGMETMNRAQMQISQGQPPGDAIIDGICIFIGGVFLFAPGFISDIAGFLLVLPATRKPLKNIVRRAVMKMMGNGTTIIYRK